MTTWIGALLTVAFDRTVGVLITTELGLKGLRPS